ncbi:MAG TPA: hypothetical protein VGE01_02560 [Fimbriimonas sp.]
MIVPNYVPEPLEVPGNVTEERYPVRLAFIRRVSLLHLLSVGVVAGLTFLPVPSVGWAVPSAILAGILIALDLVRIQKRREIVEASISAYALPLVLLAAGWWIRELSLAGAAVWAPLVGILAVNLYTVLCRNDYSFVGCWVLSLIGSTVAVAALIDSTMLGSTYAAWALGLNAAYLTYHVYDLASLMARRRKGETLAAVVDLYRDVFNIFGYIPRVLAHWRKHRIWAK